MKKHRQHLQSRKAVPFNLKSKAQEEVAKSASNSVWNKLIKLYPSYNFNNLKSLELNSLNAQFALDYMNRGLTISGLPPRNLGNLQAVASANGIKPDGGIFFVKSKKDDFNHIICAIEVKHQGEYDGYTPISDSAWIRRKGDPQVSKNKRPPQAQGNAIERFAKNANAIKSLTSFYGYNPYIVFCEGFDFYLQKDYRIFSHQVHAKRYKGKDSAILMRLIAGNDWLPLNKAYVNGIKHGATQLHPAAIYARMSKWTEAEIANTALLVIGKTIKHLKSIGEI